MRYPDGYPGDWIVAESKNYILRGSYELAILYDKSESGKEIYVGDHYGDVVDGIIDSEERFCVTVGCGIVVYFLKYPFDDYEYNKNTDQWYELWRDPKKIRWIEKVKQIAFDTIEITDEYGIVEQICLTKYINKTI